MSVTDPARAPLVTIVMPTYNRAAMLDGAIESCAAQTWPNLEIIIVDDGSSDNTAEVVAAWVARDPRIRYHKQQNGKIPKALNAGFELASGELFTWTSDDNLFEPDGVEIMANHLCANPEVGLVYCNMKTIDESGELVGLAARQPPSALRRRNVIGACFMYRRSVAEKVGRYDPQTYLAEDYDYWLRISKVAPVARLTSAAPYRYRLHAASLTSTREADAELQAARVRLKHAQSAGERRSILADGHCAAAIALRTIGRFEDARKHYSKAIQLAPWRMAAYKGLAASVMGHAPRA